MSGSGVNHGMYLCPGADVVVADDLGDWLGRIIAIGATRNTQPVVAVLEPRGNRDRFKGQQVTCTLWQLRAVSK